MKSTNSNQLLKTTQIEAIRRKYCLSSLDERHIDRSACEKVRQRVASSQGFQRSPLKSQDNLMNNQQHINGSYNFITQAQQQGNSIQQFKVNSLSVEAKRIKLMDSYQNENSPKIFQKQTIFRHLHQGNKGQNINLESSQGMNHGRKNSQKSRVRLDQDNLGHSYERRLVGNVEQAGFQRNKVDTQCKYQTLAASKITMPLPRFSRFTRVTIQEETNNLPSRNARRRRVVNLSSNKLNIDSVISQQQSLITQEDEDSQDRSALFLLSTLSAESVSLQTKQNTQSGNQKKRSELLAIKSQQLPANSFKTEGFQQRQSQEQHRYEKTQKKHSLSMTDFASQKDASFNDSPLKYERLRELTSQSSQQDNLLEPTCDIFDNINILSLSLGSVEFSEEKQKYQPTEQFTNKKVLVSSKDKRATIIQKQYFQQEEVQEQDNQHKVFLRNNMYSELQKEQEISFDINQLESQEFTSSNIESNQSNSSSTLTDRLLLEKKKQAEIDLLKLNCSLIAHMQNTRNLFSSALPSQLSIQLEELINKLFDNASETLKTIDQQTNQHNGQRLEK